MIWKLVDKRHTAPVAEVVEEVDPAALIHAVASEVGPAAATAMAEAGIKAREFRTGGRRFTGWRLITRRPPSFWRRLAPLSVLARPLFVAAFGLGSWLLIGVALSDLRAQTDDPLALMAGTMSLILWVLEAIHFLSPIPMVIFPLVMLARAIKYGDWSAGSAASDERQGLDLVLTTAGMIVVADASSWEALNGQVPTVALRAFTTDPTNLVSATTDGDLRLHGRLHPRRYKDHTADDDEFFAKVSTFNELIAEEVAAHKRHHRAPKHKADRSTSSAAVEATEADAAASRQAFAAPAAAPPKDVSEALALLSKTGAGYAGRRFGAGADAPLVTERLEAVVEIGMKFFARLDEVGTPQQVTMAAGTYTHLLGHLAGLVDPAYLGELFAHPELWTNPGERIGEIADAITAVEAQLRDDIRALNDSADIEQRVSLRTIAAAVAPDAITAHDLINSPAPATAEAGPGVTSKESRP